MERGVAGAGASCRLLCRLAEESAVRDREGEETLMEREGEILIRVPKENLTT